MKMLDVPQSGSIAGVTSSRNRYGQYRRTRAIPVNPNTVAQALVRARLGGNAAAFRALTAAQQAGWSDLGLQITRTDSLGQTYNLTGAQAYASVNNNQLLAGNAILTDAPGLKTPDAIDTLTLTATDTALSLAFTPTPAGTNDRVLVYASPQRSAGRQFENDFRNVFVGAAASASPCNILAAYTAKFGAPVIGNKIFVSAQVYSGGFLSAPAMTSKVVVLHT
jgi:hypothetical protein